MPIRLRPAIGFATACFVGLLSAGGAGLVIDAQAPVQPPSGPPAAPRAADAPVPPDAPVRDPAKPPGKTGRSVIRGRVVVLDSGTPLRRVLVRLMGADMRMPRASYTDAQGNYTFKDLPAGRYQLQASKGGFVQVAFGQRRPLEQGRPIELADGQTLEKIDFHLPRGGVIAGRIVDELGEAVTGASVKALVFRRVSGRRRLVAAGYGQTNDIGQYRLFGLPPGEYYVSAGGLDASIGAEGMTDNPSGSGYAPTYYPGTPSLGEAQRVTVNIGAEVSADLQLTPIRVSRISGTIVDQEGRPAQAAFVSLRLRDPSLGESDEGYSAATVGAEGAFSISSVAPGSYYLIGHIFGDFSSRKHVSGWVPISMTGQDIEGIRIVATNGATVKGRVIYEGSARPANPLGFPLRVGCETTGGDDPVMMQNASPAKVDEQGQFELTGVHRECLIRAFLPTPDDWAIAAVTHDSQDVTDRPLAVKDAETITDVTIMLTNRLARLTGTVTGADNRPAKDYVVIVFAEDPDKLRPPSRFVRSARADQEGQFKMSGLLPGDYLAAAFDTVEEGAESDPELLEQVRSSSVPLRLSDDGQQTITLKLIRPTP